MIIGLVIAAVVVYARPHLATMAPAAAASAESPSSGTAATGGRTSRFRCLAASGSAAVSDRPEGVPARRPPGRDADRAVSELAPTARSRRQETSQCRR